MPRLKCRLVLDLDQFRKRRKEAQLPDEVPLELESGDDTEGGDAEDGGSNDLKLEAAEIKKEEEGQFEDEVDNKIIADFVKEEVSTPKGPRGKQRLKCRLALDLDQFRKRRKEAQLPDEVPMELESGDDTEGGDAREAQLPDEVPLKLESGDDTEGGDAGEAQLPDEVPLELESGDDTEGGDAGEAQLPDEVPLELESGDDTEGGDAGDGDDVDAKTIDFENDEVSTPKGPRGKQRLPKVPDFPKNKNWISPQLLIDEVFSKRRTLRSKNDDAAQFQLPTDPNVIMKEATWHVSELMVLKRQLNEVKSLLDNLPLNSWHMHTKRMNIAHLIVNHVKTYFNPEFSSQAWGKMFEILGSYDVFPPSVLDELTLLELSHKGAGQQIPFDSVHLCEAPGAFVSALNHFIKISFKGALDWNWLATTLNPYYEGNDTGKMINDDRLIMKSMDHWSFLEDATGNILSARNISKLVVDSRRKLIKPRVEKGQKSHRVLLVTADGSIDCQTSPAEQEKNVAHLQFAEIVAALKLLQPGGSFVLKIFTFLESVTICHLYLLSCAFGEVHLFKPSTSKEGNSEVYVICLGFLGGSCIKSLVENHLFPIVESYGDELQKGKTLFPLNLVPQFFIDRIIEASEFFCKYQMKIILRNTSCFPCEPRMYQIMKPFRKEVAEQWIFWSEIRKLTHEERLFTSEDDHMHIRGSCHLDVKEEKGTFMDKMTRENGTDYEKLMYLKEEFPSYVHWSASESHRLFGRPIKVGPVVFEKPYDNIRCSRFCYGRILSDREKVREIAQNYLAEVEKQGVRNMEHSCPWHNEKHVQALVQNHNIAVDEKPVKVLCFMKASWEIMTETDFQLQKKDLGKLFSTVKTMDKGRSVYLCRFPMLTRLQTGLVSYLVGLFEKATIYGDLGKMLFGIMLYNFRGRDQLEGEVSFRMVNGILEGLNDEECDWPALQIAPIRNLIGFLPSEFLLRYNVVLLAQDTTRVIHVTAECARKFSQEKKEKEKKEISHP